ncbi:MAG: rhomboid family intramembrane serine protease [Solirubrobacteraceae bacterium]
MSSGADLFVVCRHCGSEVSPYITECPYCGQRIRRRAPKLPRDRPAQAREGGRAEGSRRERRLPLAGIATRPYATVALVLGAAGLWVATYAGFVPASELEIAGPLNGEWWRLAASPFLYESGIYAFVAVLAIAIFGWLLERRHGPLLVLALFFGASVGGALVAEVAYSEPFVSGGNAAALALIGAWAVPDLRAARQREWYEGDLLGAAALAAALLAIPFVAPEASWLSGVVGGAIGLLLGVGLGQIASYSEL